MQTPSLLIARKFHLQSASTAGLHDGSTNTLTHTFFIFALLFQTDLITIRAALGVQCSAVRNVRNAISELWHNFYAQTRCLLRWAARFNARYR